MDDRELSAALGISDERVASCVEAAKRTLVPDTRSFRIVENGASIYRKVTREGVGPLNTEFGTFHHFCFRINDDWQKYSAIVMAELTDDLSPIFKDPSRLLLRPDSGCETGQLFGDRTCDCRAQLHVALQQISAAGEGLVINIPAQDGRGLGLAFKLATLRLQRDLHKLSTTQAFGLLEPNAERDTRTYSGVVAILKYFNISTETQLLISTNNPKKLGVYVENGWPQPTLVANRVEPTEFTEHHFRAKEQDLGHVNLLPGES